MNDTLTDFEPRGHTLCRVATEIVIFTIHQGALQVLLRRKATGPDGGDAWALPGGDVGIDEPLDQCAERALAEQTGMHDVYLEQLYTFGRPDRHPAERVVSVAHYALISGDRAGEVDAGSRSRWWNIEHLPGLYLDHGRIVSTARRRLAAKLEYSTIAFQLMPEYFTLSELQQVYEIICGKIIDKRNFRKRVLAIEHVQPTDRKQRNGSHRPARLYRYTARDAVHYLK